MTLLSTRPRSSTTSRSFGVVALFCVAFASLILFTSLSLGSPRFSNEQSELVKRQIPSSVEDSCGLIVGNSQTICFPSANSTLYNNTWYQFSWNIKYPTYAQSAYVDIYLYYLNDYQYNHVKSWPNVSNVETGGNLAVLTDNSFFAKPLAPGSANETLQYCLFIVGANTDPDTEIKNPDSKYPKPAFFYFDENAPPASNLSASVISSSSSVQSVNTVTASSTVAASPSMVSTVIATSGTNNNNGKLAPWMIAVIAAAGVAVAVACLAAILAIRATKKGKYDKKVYSAEPMIIAPNSKGAPGPSLYDSRDISSIHSTTPIIHGHQRSPTNEGNVSIFSAATGRGTIRQDSGGNRSTYSPSLSPSNSPLQPHTQLIAPAFATPENPPIPTINEPRSSTSVLTSNDAMLIADTFRQFMRKPDWQEQELNDLSSPSTPGNEEEEEERRRRLGDELLRKELAEEGTPMQRVQRKATHVNILDVEKQALDGMTEKELE